MQLSKEGAAAPGLARGAAVQVGGGPSLPSLLPAIVARVGICPSAYGLLQAGPSTGRDREDPNLAFSGGRCMQTVPAA